MPRKFATKTIETILDPVAQQVTTIVFNYTDMPVFVLHSYTLYFLASSCLRFLDFILWNLSVGAKLCLRWVSSLYVPSRDIGANGQLMRKKLRVNCSELAA